MSGIRRRDLITLLGGGGVAGRGARAAVRRHAPDRLAD